MPSLRKNGVQAESLGDGLIDLSGKDLISALVNMKIFSRFRFFLHSSNISALYRIKVVKMLKICANHSLSVASRIFDEPFLVQTMVDLLPMAERDGMESVIHVFHALGRMGSQIARRIFETKSFEQCIIFSMLSSTDQKIRRSSVELFSSFVKLGLGRGLAQKIIPTLMENIDDYWQIIAAFFATAENTRENFERFRSVLKSVPRTRTFYLKLLKVLIEKWGKLESERDFSTISDLLPTLETPKSVLKKREIAGRQINIHKTKLFQFF